MRDYFEHYPGRKWQLGSVVLAILGVILGFGVGLVGVGSALMASGAIGLTLWKGGDDKHYGWPPAILGGKRRDPDTPD